MLDKELLETMKGLSREERLEYFNEHRSELVDETLEVVSGGAEGVNPNTNSNGASDGNGNYYTSMGFMCRGERYC